MSIEIITCKTCKKEFDAISADLGTYTCPHCKPKPKEKILDKVYLKIMPFGKFAGKPFYSIPDVYLEWLEMELLNNKESIKNQKNTELLASITAELKRRKDNPKARV